MLSFIRFCKKKIQNTVLDKIIRIFVNALSPSYYSLSLWKKKHKNDNNVFIFICYGGMGDCILLIPLINKL